MFFYLRWLTHKNNVIYRLLDGIKTNNIFFCSPLEKLKDFTGAESWDDVAAGVIGFGASHLGRQVADACLRDLKKNFRGDIWGNNGPGVITRTLQKICATKYVSILFFFYLIYAV